MIRPWTEWMLILVPSPKWRVSFFPTESDYIARIRDVSVTKVFLLNSKEFRHGGLTRLMLWSIRDRGWPPQSRSRSSAVKGFKV
jgi:hypothetical protein